ncbi:MAG: hypothetical protein WBE97_03050 [Candidatus Acidiferrales bacterium]
MNLNDFKSLFPELLIPGDFKSFAPEVLILVGLKSFGMSAIQKSAKFLEVLILEELERRSSEAMILRGLGAENLWRAALCLADTR